MITLHWGVTWNRHDTRYYERSWWITIYPRYTKSTVYWHPSY